MISESQGAFHSGSQQSSLRVFSITSGKGGVGKTNLVVNMALHLSRKGLRVLIMDADLGLANVDIILGLQPAHRIDELLQGDVTLDDVLMKGPGGIYVLPASSGVVEMAHLSDDEQTALITELDALEDRFDVVLIDTGAGISPNVLRFNAAAQEVVVICTPEPTSITDAYAIMKVLHTRYQVNRFRLLVNQVKTPNQALKVYQAISNAADGSIHVSIDYLGHVFRDDNLVRAVLTRKPLMEAFPTSPAARCIADIADQLWESPQQDDIDGGIKFFWRRLARQKSSLSAH